MTIFRKSSFLHRDILRFERGNTRSNKLRTLQTTVIVVCSVHNLFERVYSFAVIKRMAFNSLFTAKYLFLVIILW